MQQIETPQLTSVAGSQVDPQVTLSDRIDFAASFLRRRYRVVLVGLLACLPLGALYHYSSPATYAASTTIMMETQRGLLQEAILGIPE